MTREPKKQEAEEIEEEKVEEIAEVVEEVEKEKAVIPEGWKPRTELGKKVLAGEVKEIEKLFAEGIKIAEPPIVDVLLPDLEKDIILIGGTTGKGGGIRRTPFRRTARMHKSGRRYKASAMSVVGNKNGYVGVGVVSGPPGKQREILEKSVNRAKLNIIPIMRGCGSWECMCGENHSIPFAVEGKSGSVVVKLIPAPKGVGLVVSDEVKKVMRLAGISDIWCNTRGNTHMRTNLIMAVFNALRKLNSYKLKADFEKKVGLKMGKAD